MNLGEKLKSIRLDKAIMLIDAAKKLDISPSTLAGYESGYRTPNVEMLKKLAKLYKVTVDFLLKD